MISTRAPFIGRLQGRHHFNRKALNFCSPSGLQIFSARSSRCLLHTARGNSAFGQRVFRNSIFRSRNFPRVNSAEKPNLLSSPSTVRRGDGQAVDGAPRLLTLTLTLTRSHPGWRDVSCLPSTQARRPSRRHSSTHFGFHASNSSTSQTG